MRGVTGTSDPWRTVQNGYEVLGWFEGPPWRDTKGRLRRRLRVKFWHHVVWEQAHGQIPKGCVIHHKDGNPLNNDLANLECLTNAEHTRHHMGARLRARFDGERKRCARCTTWRPVADFGRDRGDRTGLSTYCLECARTERKTRYHRLHPVPAPPRRPTFRDDGTHRCFGCGEWKPLTEFGKVRSKTGGVASLCRPCARAHWQAWYRRKRQRHFFGTPARS